VTSALVLAEPLRVLHRGSRYEFVSMSLRTPEYVETAPAAAVPHGSVSRFERFAVRGCPSAATHLTI